MADNLLNVTLTGDRELVTRLSSIPEIVSKALRAKIEVLTVRLQAYVVTQKLHGQVLHQRSGRLARSIQRRVEASELAVYGFVFSAGDVKYAAIHEFGGKTPPHEIRPKKAEVLAFAMGGKTVFAKVVHHPGSQMPERSFLRSSLGENRQMIEDELRETVIDAAQGALR